ncbi:MAG: hypothetical protein RLN69_02715, partial [Woeseiaceae bacterium]
MKSESGSKFLAQVGYRNAPVIVGKPHTFVDDRPGYGETYDRRARHADVVKIMPNRELCGSEVSASKRPVVSESVAVGIGQRKPGIRASDIANQQDLLTHLIS